LRRGPGCPARQFGRADRCHARAAQQTNESRAGESRRAVVQSRADRTAAPSPGRPIPLRTASPLQPEAIGAGIRAAIRPRGSCHARVAQQMSPARVNRAARTSRVAPQGAACSLLEKMPRDPLSTVQPPPPEASVCPRNRGRARVAGARDFVFSESLRPRRLRRNAASRVCASRVNRRARQCASLCRANETIPIEITELRANRRAAAERVADDIPPRSRQPHAGITRAPVL